MAQDVQAVLSQRWMPVVVLTDGSPEMMNLLDQALAAHAPMATEVVGLVDFWQRERHRPILYLDSVRSGVCYVPKPSAPWLRQPRALVRWRRR